MEGYCWTTSDGMTSEGRSTDDLVMRVVLTALVVTGGLGTGIAISTASGGSSSGAAR